MWKFSIRHTIIIVGLLWLMEIAMPNGKKKKGYVYSNKFERLQDSQHGVIILV
jgi:hypothetical protein